MIKLAQKCGKSGIIMFKIKVQNKWIRAAIPALLLH